MMAAAGSSSLPSSKSSDALASIPVSSQPPSDSSSSTTTSTAVGRQPISVYSLFLPKWRSKLRSYLVLSLEKNEMKWLEWIQKTMRRNQRWESFFDNWFGLASLLGTHTFFLIFLPILYWFSLLPSAFATSSLLHTLSLGVYIASFIKDLLCVPRPYSPPVQRLTPFGMGAHALEYGFPSTHSTNAVSMGIGMWGMVGDWVAALSSSPSSSSLEQQNLILNLPDSNITKTLTLNNSTNPATEFLTTTISDSLGFNLNYIPDLPTILLYSWGTFLTIYVLSVVLGRIYCGMHSGLDCLVGSLLGVGIGKFVRWGEPWLEKWVKGAGWDVPTICIPLILYLVSVHPEPVDDCPCFEDAIAFMSVSLGVIIGHWSISAGSLHVGTFTVHSLFAPNNNNDFSPSSHTLVVFIAAIIAKLVIGVGIIFLWRLVAKEMLHYCLPPIFRALEPVFGLLPRRHYAQATEYDKYKKDDGGGLHPIPSVLDLPALNRPPSLDDDRNGFSTTASPYLHPQLQNRAPTTTNTNSNSIGNGNGNGNGTIGISGQKLSPLAKQALNKNSSSLALAVAEKSPPLVNEKFGFVKADNNKLEGGEGSMMTSEGINKKITHYDVDVLTKFCVYSGIGLLGTAWLPYLFTVLGLTV